MCILELLTQDLSIQLGLCDIESYRYIVFVCRVCHIAGQLVTKLNEENKWFTKEEKMCIQIAALCHDVGK